MLAPRRNLCDEPFGEIPVRVNHRHPAPVHHVLESDCLQERRFAGPGLADRVGMKEPVGLFDAKGSVRISPVGCREV